MAKLSEWTDTHARICGFCESIARGEADEDDQEPMTIEKLEKEQPEKLVPLPHDQGLAVSLTYERSSQEHKFKPARSGGEG